MKKTKKAALIAATFAVALNINGCVYGPPQEVTNTDSGDDIEVVETVKPEDEADVVFTEVYNPAEQGEVCVYGPPEDFAQ